MKYVLIILLLAGCDMPQMPEHKCINNKVYVRKGNIWSEVYSSPCYPVEEKQ
jgi:hypothetical protein